MKVKLESCYPSKEKVVFLSCFSFGYDHSYENEKSLFLLIGFLFWMLSVEYIFDNKE